LAIRDPQPARVSVIIQIEPPEPPPPSAIVLDVDCPLLVTFPSINTVSDAVTLTAPPPAPPEDEVLQEPAPPEPPEPRSIG